MRSGSLRTSIVALRRSYSSTLSSTAAGRPFRVTTTSSSRSWTPATSSGSRAFTSEIGSVLGMTGTSSGPEFWSTDYRAPARRSSGGTLLGDDGGHVYSDGLHTARHLPELKTP